MPRKPKPPPEQKPERRTYGSGSIVERPNGRYQAAAYTDAGRRVTRTFDTEKQADAWLVRTRAKRLDGTLEFVDNRLTTGELLDWWYETYCSMRTTNTRASYRWGVKVLAAPLRAIPAARLRVDQVQRRINELHEAGRGDSTIRVLVVVLNQAFTRGVADLHLPRVPTTGLRFPEKTWKPAPSWTLAQAQAFLAVAEHDELALFWSLLLSTGMRQGELRGLCWEAIDLEAGIINVWFTCSRDGRTLGLTKNKRRRALRVDAQLIEALKRRREAWPAPARGYVFPFKGHGFTGNAIRLRFAALVARVPKLPRLTPHGARHTAASVLRDQGADLKDVQEILGHASITTTSNTYVHTPAERQGEALSRLAAALSKRPASGDQ